MNLAQFSSAEFDRGRPSWVEAAWLLVRAVAFASVNPSNKIRVAALRLFGARIGKGVVIKPGVKIKFPWRLHVGDYSWIGEDVWIDNLGLVTIGAHSCISQGTYLCTGNHDWKRESFDLTLGPIVVGSEVWIAAKVVIGPGVAIADHSIVTLGCVLTHAILQPSVCKPGESSVFPRDLNAAATDRPEARRSAGPPVQS